MDQINKFLCKYLRKIDITDYYLNNKDVLEKEVISKNAAMSYEYANNFLNGRFIIGEDEISKYPKIMYLYAKNVIKDKLPEDMHNKMIGYGLQDSDMECVKNYFKLIKPKKQKKVGLEKQKYVPIETFITVVLNAIRDGKTIKDASATLGIKPQSIRARINRLIKLGVNMPKI